MPELPTHSTCPHCQNKQPLGVWVYAHWDIPLQVTCDKPLGCGQTYNMQRGICYPVRRNKTGVKGS